MALYVREGCHLCEAFIDEIKIYNSAWLSQLIIRDVDDSTEWIRDYGEHVPALVIDGRLICEYFFDPDKVSAYSRD